MTLAMVLAEDNLFRLISNRTKYFNVLIPDDSKALSFKLLFANVKRKIFVYGVTLIFDN